MLFSGWIRLSKGLYSLTGLGQSPTGLIPMVGTRNGTIQPYPYFVLIKEGIYWSAIKISEIIDCFLQRGGTAASTKSKTDLNRF